MTIREAAASLGLSPSKVRQLCRDRKIEHYRHGDRLVISPEQLEAYRQSCLVVSLVNEKEARWMAYLETPKNGKRKA